jgi:signal transduction histidine kinase
VPALERLLQTFGDQTGSAVEFESGAVGSERLPAEVETALYRIVQESLTNIVKHARASRVSVVLARKADSVAVVIEDDGAGFDPQRVREDGFGLSGMRERMALLEGRLEIESSEGGGTTLVGEVPVR